MHHPIARMLFVSSALLAATSAMAADVSAPVWIFLKDKGYESDVALRSAASDFRLTMNADSLRRRQVRGRDSFATAVSDLPVSSRYSNSISSLGATIRVQSAWLNAISIQATPAQLAQIRNLPFVDHVQPVARVGSTLSTPEPTSGKDAPGKFSQPQEGPPAFYGASYDQLQQINVPAVHDLGFTGSGIKIGILDTGFKRTHDFFNHPGHAVNVLAEHDFIENDNNTADTTNGQHQHGTYVLGTIGAYKPNVLVGGAYDASFLLAKTEDVSQEVMAEEDQWVAGLEYLEANGADIVTSSLGYIDWYTQAQLNGNTAVTTLAANAAARRGLPITNAAGNEGNDANPSTSHLIAPADADLLITVGAVDSSGASASFTSDGPTADGRIKPEIMARGVAAQTVTAMSDGTFTAVSGTSFATPITAAATALIIQAHPDWSVEQLRYAMFQTASGNGAFDPMYVRGYGILNTLAAVQYTFDKYYTSPSSGNWITGSNWTGATSPLAVHNVFITPTNGLSVAGPTVSSRIHKLTLGATSTGTAILNLNANATFTIDTSTTINPRGQLNLNSGTLLSGAVANHGAIVIGAARAELASIRGTGSLTINNGGSVVIPLDGTDAGTSTMRSLTLAGATNAWAAKLDLADNDLIVDHNGASPLATMTNQIKTARNGGAWNANGIASSVANANLRSLGIAEASDVLSPTGGEFSGQNVDGSAVLVKYSWYGDADLNGVVDFDDYVRTDNGFNNSLPGWSNGDFDYSNSVEFDDYVLIDLAFNTQNGTLIDALNWLEGEDRSGSTGSGVEMVIQHYQQFGQDYANAFYASVPEPTFLSLAPALGALMLARYRRNDDLRH